MSVTSYAEMNGDETMQKFYKVIYSQRSLDPTAAQIVAEETKKMIAATKALFYALSAHKKIECDRYRQRSVQLCDDRTFDTRLYS